MDKFSKPDEATIRRMTPRTIQSLLQTLRAQRREKTNMIDQEITFYEELLNEKIGDDSA